ncbi:MAG: hypothetical protein WAT70_10430, partial [Rhizobiaceae bacterium]
VRAMAAGRPLTPGAALTPADAIAEGALKDADPRLAAALDRLRAIVANSASLEDMMATIRSAGGVIPEGELQTIMTQAMLLAELTGRAEIGAR